MSENLGASIGHIFKTSQDVRQDAPNLDWALFTIENSSLYLPNVVAAREVTQNIDQNTVGTAERRVVLTTATSGLLYGRLSSSSSYLMLAPGNGLVKTNALRISGSQGWCLFHVP
jgi:hypothetical protein